MMPCIEDNKVFARENYYAPNQMLRHHNLNEASQIAVRKGRGK